MNVPPSWRGKRARAEGPIRCRAQAGQAGAAASRAGADCGFAGCLAPFPVRPRRPGAGVPLSPCGIRSVSVPGASQQSPVYPQVWSLHDTHTVVQPQQGPRSGRPALRSPPGPLSESGRPGPKPGLARSSALPLSPPRSVKRPSGFASSQFSPFHVISIFQTRSASLAQARVLLFSFLSRSRYQVSRS